MPCTQKTYALAVTLYMVDILPKEKEKYSSLQSITGNAYSERQLSGIHMVKGMVGKLMMMAHLILNGLVPQNH